MSRNIDDLEKLLFKHFKKSKESNLSVGIRINNESKVYSTSGVDINQTYGLGSVSKTFIGTYYSKLIDEGKINLNDRIDQFLEMPVFEHCPTIIELLTHHSGYSYFVPRIPTLRVMLFNGFNKKNLYTNISYQWVNDYLKKHKPTKIKNYKYSDFNYVLLSLIIEKIMSKPYQEVMMDFIQNELLLKSTAYYNDDSSKESLYSWIWEDDNPFKAAGGVYSTVPDMLNYLTYQIENPKAKAGQVKYFKTRKAEIFTGFSWNSYKNSSFYWHIGGQGRFRSYALFDIKRKISIIVLCTVNVDIQHVVRLGSNIYRNSKRNSEKLFEFLDDFSHIKLHNI